MAVLFITRCEFSKDTEKTVDIDNTLITARGRCHDGENDYGKHNYEGQYARHAEVCLVAS